MGKRGKTFPKHSLFGGNDKLGPSRELMTANGNMMMNMILSK